LEVQILSPAQEYNDLCAEVAERSIARDCKSLVRKDSSGSNPDLSTAFNAVIGALNAPLELHIYYVYVLYSNKDKHLYIGSTPDLRVRMLKHKTGRIRSTKNRRPLDLIYYEAYLLRVDVLRREKYLKSGGGRKELAKQLDSYFTKINYQYSR
jgi:putative endonuclease